MKTKLTLTLIAIATLGLLYTGYQYKRYSYYKSDEFKKVGMSWFLNITRYHAIKDRTPTFEEFAIYAQSDTIVADEFPDLIPPRVSYSDIKISSDTCLIYMWLLKKQDEEEKVRYLPDMNFWNFIKGKGCQLIAAPITSSRMTYTKSIKTKVATSKLSLLPRVPQSRALQKFEEYNQMYDSAKVYKKPYILRDHSDFYFDGFMILFQRDMCEKFDPVVFNAFIQTLLKTESLFNRNYLTHMGFIFLSKPEEVKQCLLQQKDEVVRKKLLKMLKKGVNNAKYKSDIWILLDPDNVMSDLEAAIEGKEELK